MFFVLSATLLFAALSASPLLHSSRAAGPETIELFAGDCFTPKTTFYLGDTICVRAANFPAAPGLAPHYRRVNLSAPNLGVVDTIGVMSDPDYYKFWIPSTGTFAQPGKWRVQTVDVETSAVADITFVVRYPRWYLADMLVLKQGPDWVLPGDRIRYEIKVRNNGPDFAEYVQFSEQVPTNATYYGLKVATDLPYECRVPAVGGTGSINCTVKGLKVDEEATFYAYYIIDERAKEGDTCEGGTQVYSRTEELNKVNNETWYSSLITRIGTDPGPSDEVDNPEGMPTGETPPSEGENPKDMPPGPTPTPEPENPPGIPPPDDVPPPEPENP
ncbi:MAG TPA: hypothetical protein VG148_17360 [Pyrinomonadaceae bacterium]|nr:hypothetical protein [Pyrinomonadaceae bacterium]